MSAPRRAVLRCGHGGDGRRSVATFGARLGAICRTHSTGCRELFCVLCGQRRRPAWLLLLLRPYQARVGQAISEMEGTCHQTWMAGLAPERDAIGTWAVDEIGTFGPRRNQLQFGMMEPWQMCDRRAGMPGTTDPSRP